MLKQISAGFLFLFLAGSAYGQAMQLPPAGDPWWDSDAGQGFIASYEGTPWFEALASMSNCDQSLWKHVYKPKRLVVKAACVTVTGTIEDATATEKTHHKDGQRHEGDGDGHGWLKLDPGQEQYLNAGNKSNEGGNLVFEVICQFPVRQADAKAACKGYKNTVKIPPVGSHVKITGPWVQDKEHQKWFEIHPVTKIEVI
jgi:hypothetical protein